MFDRKGLLTLEAASHDEDALMEAALDGGAEDVRREDEQFIVTTDPAAVHAVRGALESHGMHIAGSEIAWLPKTTVRVEGKTAESLIRLLEEIDELDDVQKVDANFDMDVADMASA
jgi:transcriptional/translational regulatory protein YebC/TACO1